MGLMKTTWEVTVLHRPDKRVGELSLADIALEIDEGDCLGAERLVRSERVPEHMEVAEQIALGGDGTFFDWDDDEKVTGGLDQQGTPGQGQQEKTPARYAVAAWTAGDVLTLRPALSEEEAERWLADNAKRIQDAMVQAGWEAMEAALDIDGHAATPVQ